MMFSLKGQKVNIQNLVRGMGYRALGTTEKGEINAVRPIMGQHYPRFHAYIKEVGPDIIFNVHLDQKKPSYEGSTAHSGDYDSEIMKEEIERMKGEIVRVLGLKS